MKTKIILLLLIGSFISGNAEAQIFKELVKAVGKKDKKEPDTSKAKNKGMDEKVMNIFGGGMEGLPETYSFSYIINMQITSNKDETTLHYYVAPNATYFGNAIPQDHVNSVVVYDMENEAMVTFMDDGKQKMAMTMRLPFSDKKMQVMLKKEADDTMKNGNIIPLPDKTILGFNCKGYQIADKDGVSKIWFTNEAPVSFVGMFASADKMPKNLDGAMIPFGPKSMMLEMEYTSNKKKKDNMRMLCTGIEEKNFAIERKDYKTGL
ncbi:DUF4412 domain-containing protein [Cellulophaga sp. F20128]|uniref:DUF4412 domain-containing protein n=1 Tax=Cellulophaga sp. F20128 TaxID=2926413 RepID=UPI001FF32E19|nr:DUF4412 domain-containing protein [Cellulophaga sp. F20128]MCK0158562.1 DUF4412 domain-containing protein [Cellulophaga sp. F20128]